MARIGRNQLIKLQKRYKTDDAIGQLYGISRQAVHQLRKKYGVVPVDDKYESRNRSIRQLYRRGVTGPRLASQYSLSLSQIYRILKKQ